MFNVVSSEKGGLTSIKAFVMSVQNSLSRLLNADFRRSGRVQGNYEDLIDFEPTLHVSKLKRSDNFVCHKRG